MIVGLVQRRGLRTEKKRAQPMEQDSVPERKTGRIKAASGGLGQGRRDTASPETGETGCQDDGLELEPGEVQGRNVDEFFKVETRTQVTLESEKTSLETGF